MAAAYINIHEEIIELCKAGDSKSQYQLYKLYAKAMYNICYRMMSSKEEAEDMLQESFAEAFMKLDTFRYESAFGVWLKRIVINKCINSLKRKKAELILTDNLPDMDDTNNGEDNLDTRTLKVKDVQKAMEMLPQGYRVIFSLYLLEGYDHSEIAQIMGVSESTSKSQYSRARQKIKELLIKSGS